MVRACVCVGGVWVETDQIQLEGKKNNGIK
jgi:hypothetical protein